MKKGTSTQELTWHVLSLTNLKSRSSSSEKLISLKSEYNCERYARSALNLESDPSLEQLLAALPDSGRGSKRISLSEALVATTRLTIKLTSTLSMNFVNYWQVFLDSSKLTSKCPHTAVPNLFFCRMNRKLHKCRVGNRTKVGNSRSPERIRSPKKNYRRSPASSKTTSL